MSDSIGGVVVDDVVVVLVAWANGEVRPVALLLLLLLLGGGGVEVSILVFVLIV